MPHSPEPIALVLLITILGLVVGSFLATLVVRLPLGQSIIFGRSHCDACGTTLRPWQLVPVIGWLWQKGRCQFCDGPISSIYVVMELGAAATCLWSLAVVPPTILIPSIALGWLLLTLAVMDWRYLRLSDALTLPLAVLGLITAWTLARVSFFDHIVGMFAGAAFLYGVNAAYRFVRRRDGLGMGDVKLAGAAGAWLGWQGLPSVFVLAAGAALALLLVHRLLGTMIDWHMKVAFGSYLCFGTWIVWLYGPITWG